MAETGLEGKKLVKCTLNGVAYSVFVDESLNDNLNSRDLLCRVEAQRIVKKAVKEACEKDDNGQEELTIYPSTSNQTKEESSKRHTLNYDTPQRAPQIISLNSLESSKRHTLNYDTPQRAPQIISLNSSDASEGTICWTKSNTLLLIDEFRKKKKQMDSGQIRKKVVWDQISQTLKERGFKVTSDQVCGKWKTLMRGYKLTKDNNKKSGSARKSFEYENELDEIYGNDPIVQPILTLSSTENKKIDHKIEASDVEAESSIPKPIKKRKSVSGDISETIKVYLQESRQRQDEAIVRNERMHEDRIKAYKGVENVLRDFLNEKKK